MCRLVKVLVEVAADDTFEVAVPRIVNHTPVLYSPGTGPPGFRSRSLAIEEGFEPQGLGVDVQDSSKESTFMPPAPSIAGIPNDDGGLSASSHCIGEKITSLRALAKRAAPYISSVAVTTSNTLSFRPKIIALTRATDTVSEPSVMGADYVSMIAALFNYQRGGLKFHVYGPDVYLRAGLAPNTQTTQPILQTTGDTLQNTPFAIATGPTIAGGLAITIPQYSRTHCEMYRLYSTLHPLPTDVYCSDLRVFIKANAPYTNLRVLRQAADDWSCGFFTGCVPLQRGLTQTRAVVNF
jgi:hypothetical protein